MTSEDAAWFAGFFDGEGSISLLILRGRTYKKGSTLRKEKNPNSLEIRVYIQISNQCREPLERYKKEFGGYLGEHSNGRVKAFYKWGLAGRDRVKKFLQAIQPYLVIKLPQCILALEACSLQTGRGSHKKTTAVSDDPGRVVYYSGTELSRFIELRAMIQALNANS